MDDRPIYSALILAGATPFLACALLPVAGIESFGRLGPLHELAADYGLAILSFLTGIHWATQLYQRAPLPINLFIGSTVLDLAISLIGVVVFVGLTAYDVQRVKTMGEQGIMAQGEDVVQKGAIIGALALYLDFINLFWMLLTFFGGGRD